MSVAQGGNVVITLPQAHGLDLGSYSAISITDANAPNAIVSATASFGGNWLLETQYPHDLTYAAPAAGESDRNWNIAARIAGFTNTHMNGLLQLVEVVSPTSFIVRPSSGVETITLNGSEVLLERLENGIIGWHKMQATGIAEFSFPTPADVARSYVVANPRLSINVRIAAALNLEVAQKQFVTGYRKGDTTQNDAATAEAWMYICPPQSVALSKDRNAQTDAVAEITPTAEYRQLLNDGFFVYVFLPAYNAMAGVTCSDLASGEIFSVILRTFHGLVLPRKELYQADNFITLFTEHGQALGDYNNAFYVHGYVFQCPAYLTQEDSIQPFEWSQIHESSGTASSGIGPGSAGGTIDQTQPIAPVGSVTFRDITLELYHDEAPTPLTATVKLE
jgi:hypothetical protein